MMIANNLRKRAPKVTVYFVSIDLFNICMGRFGTIFFLTKACDIGRCGLISQGEGGHCFKADHCSHTNGSCSDGCMDGYRGEMCAKGRGFVFRILYGFKPITFKLHKLHLHISQWSFQRKENNSI